MTPLDAAFAALQARPGDDAARLRFYAGLADAELMLLLEAEASAEAVTPRLFDLEDGPVVLAFDSEERLAEFAGATVAYAALPGRVILAQLAGQGIGLGVNLGVAPSETLLDPAAIDWLDGLLQRAPEAAEALPAAFLAPGGLPEGLMTTLQAKLALASGLAAGAVLAGVRYHDGRQGHMLAILDAAESAQEALARAVAEALTFSGVEAGELDVTFLRTADPAAAQMRAVGQIFAIAAPEAKERPAPQPPGMDRANPPKLR